MEAEIFLGRFRIMHDVYGSITFAREVPMQYARPCTVVYAIDLNADVGISVSVQRSIATAVSQSRTTPITANMRMADKGYQLFSINRASDSHIVGSDERLCHL